MKNILLAEDEVHIAKLIEVKLKREGFDVLHAPNGQKAVDQMHERAFQLVILDVMMPVLDGWGALKEIRKELPQIPVLMLTAKNQIGDRSEAGRLGATDFLAKPFDPQELANVVKGLIEKNGS